MATARTWRLILDGAPPGAANMALDRAVLEAVSAGESPPTVRLYRWEVPTVSIGRFQAVGDIDVGECARMGFDVVRRPTGGRGVLHADELTYAFVASVRDSVPRGTGASYAHLSRPLAVAYASLGVDARVSRRSAPGTGGAACYLHPTKADLTAGEAKLAGSAQVWAGDAVLQHGSIVRSRDADAEARLFRLGPEGAAALRAKTATLASLLGMEVPVERIAVALVLAVGSELGVELAAGEYSGRELAAARELEQEFSVMRAARPS